MGRSRMFDDDEPEAGKNPSPRTTIVGGRPPDAGAKLPPVPTGMQTLLRMAALDAGFRRELLEKRGSVAHAAGVALNPTELKILSAVPEKQLEAMIGAMPPPTEGRRSFLQQTAASAVLLLGGAGLVEATTSCDRKPATGTDANTPQRPDHNETMTEGGAAPHEPPPTEPPPEDPIPQDPPPDAALDKPPPRPDVPAPPTGIQPDMPSPKTRGISHDMPPPRPDTSGSANKGGSEPDMP